MINSHIQMPKVLLKRFHNDNNRFFYYDVQKQIIGYNGTAKSINTQLGYYSQQTEDYFRDNIETPFGEVLTYIEKTGIDIAVHCLPSMLQDLIWLGIHEFFITDPLVDIFSLEFHGSFYYNKIYGVPLCHQGDRMGVFPCGLLLWTIRGAWSSWLKMKLLQAQLQQIPI